MIQNKSYNAYDPKPMDVITFNTSNSRKIYDKNKLADGNTEYTIRYKTAYNIIPGFTKILVNQNNDILAYIDVQRIKAPCDSQFKTWRWFGIQEFHPELIGDFIHVVTDKKHESFFRTTWQHKTGEHKYILDTSNVSRHQDWFYIFTTGGMIETNFGIMDKSTCCYEYNTHPSVPTKRIEQLKQHILEKEGIIKPKLTILQKVKDFFQIKK